MGVSRLRAYPAGLIITLRKENRIKLIRKHDHIRDIDAWIEILFLTLFFIIETTLIHHKNAINALIISFLVNLFSLTFCKISLLIVENQCCCVDHAMKKMSFAVIICKFTCLKPNCNASRKKPFLK